MSEQEQVPIRSVEAGDVVVVAAHRVGEPERIAEIVSSTTRARGVGSRTSRERGWLPARLRHTHRLDTRRGAAAGCPSC